MSNTIQQRNFATLNTTNSIFGGGVKNWLLKKVPFRHNSQPVALTGEAANSVSGIGAEVGATGSGQIGGTVGAGFGVVSAAIEMRDAFQKGDASERAVKTAEMASSVLDATKTAGELANTTSDFFDIVGSAAHYGSGGAAIASGLNDTYKAGKKFQQARKKNITGWKIFSAVDGVLGAAKIAAGVLLILSAANPIGAGILGGVAVISAGVSLLKHWRKHKIKVKANTHIVKIQEEFHSYLNKISQFTGNFKVDNAPKIFNELGNIEKTISSEQRELKATADWLELAGSKRSEELTKTINKIETDFTTEKNNFISNTPPDKIGQIVEKTNEDVSELDNIPDKTISEVGAIVNKSMEGLEQLEKLYTTCKERNATTTPPTNWGEKIELLRGIKEKIPDILRERYRKIDTEAEKSEFESLLLTLKINITEFEKEKHYLTCKLEMMVLSGKCEDVTTTDEISSLHKEYVELLPSLENLVVEGLEEECKDKMKHLRSQYLDLSRRKTARF